MIHNKKVSNKEVLAMLEKRPSTGNYTLTVSFRYEFDKKLIDRLKRHKELMDLRELLNFKLINFSNELKEIGLDLFRDKNGYRFK